jgi:hypothetical protein
MTHPQPTRKPAAVIALDRAVDALGKVVNAGPFGYRRELDYRCVELFIGLEDLRAQIPAAAKRTRAPRIRPPDGLRTPTEAAAKLACSIKTLNGHVDAGALRYVIIGHGTKRPRRMFTDADLDEFITNQTRKDAPCPSTRTRVHPTTGSTSRSTEVIAFSVRRNARRGVKPKR